MKSGLVTYKRESLFIIYFLQWSEWRLYIRSDKSEPLFISHSLQWNDWRLYVYHIFTGSERSRLFIVFEFVLLWQVDSSLITGSHSSSLTFYNEVNEDYTFVLLWQVGSLLKSEPLFILHSLQWSEWKLYVNHIFIESESSRLFIVYEFVLFWQVDPSLIRGNRSSSFILYNEMSEDCICYGLKVKSSAITSS